MKNCVTGEEVQNFYSLPNIIRMSKSRSTGRKMHVGGIQEKIIAYKILIRKSEGRKLVSKSRRRHENIINIGLNVTESEVVDWIHVVQIRDYWWSAVNIIKIV
jgi:hypothetical protein